MGTIPQSHSGRIDYPSTIKRSIERKSHHRASSNERWELRVNLKQLGILWAVVSGLMFVVFLFGFYSGRERGLARYLEDNAREPIRLPILAQAPVQDVVHNDYASIAAEQVDKVAAAPIAPSIAPQPTSDVSPLAAANNAASDNPNTNRASLALNAKIATDSKINSAPSAQPAEAKQKLETLAAIEAPVTPAPVEKAKNGKTSVETPSAATAKLAKVDDKKAQNKKTDVKATTTTAVRQDLSKGWYVQISAKKTVEEAMAVVKDLNGLGLKSVVQPAQVRNTNYYRVLSGPYSDKKSAQSGEDKILNSKVVGGSPFLKEVP